MSYSKTVMTNQLFVSLFYDCAGPFFLVLMACAFYLFIGHTLEFLNPLRFTLSQGLFIFYVGLGWFVLRALIWGYLAFHAMNQEPSGSFRVDGAYQAINKAQQFRYPNLSNLIQTQWLYKDHGNLAYSKPMPEDGFDRMVSGALEAERFRRAFVDDELNSLIGEMVNFKEISNPKLNNKYNLSGFDISDKTLSVSFKTGVAKEFATASFQSFAGSWYGLWDVHEVDHEWSQTEAYSPPYMIQDKDLVIYVHALQYAWIGDGFGWNLVVSPEHPDNSTFILGTVYHVRDHDPQQVYLHRPHVGLALGERLIWITKREVFFEEAYLDLSPQQYAITGFFYESNGGEITRKGDGFQAVYSKSSGKRVPFRRIPLN